ncbi:copper resistance protein NlpE [uncultured Vibrio sp.]|uniref:copper resistance protein NlpE n=1 Tax=uncultured Vibrio sp. TaxID=114054 RepID=UPI002607D7AF|nr:copper resistance protein NlpE N-terminal domain-containing protein [uncultured Vibrio sp.]
MKKTLYVVLMAAAALAGCQNKDAEQGQTIDTTPVMVEAAHSARTSLDWNGIYQGTVPCEDCAGTDLLLELKVDGQYSLGRSYVDKMSATVMEEGAINWNDAGNTVQVGEYHFFVAENQLFLVSKDEQRLMDEEGNPYTLAKM